MQVKVYRRLYPGVVDVPLFYKPWDNIMVFSSSVYYLQELMDVTEAVKLVAMFWTVLFSIIALRII